MSRKASNVILGSMCIVSALAILTYALDWIVSVFKSISDMCFCFQFLSRSAFDIIGLVLVLPPPEAPPVILDRMKPGYPSNGLTSSHRPGLEIRLPVFRTT